MALTAKLLKFNIELADIDRGVYQTLELKVAQHPSEALERALVRVLAFALAHEEGIEFGRGLSTVEDPALLIRGGGDDVVLWIDVGAPSADRLHKASKRAGRVKVYTDKDDGALRRAWSTQKIHQAESIEVVRFPVDFIDALAALSDARQVSWVLMRQEGAVTITVGSQPSISVEPTVTDVAALVS